MRPLPKDAGVVVFELLLRLATAQPMETHVHGFSASWLDVVVDDSKCGAVVCFDRSFGIYAFLRNGA
jgi:hypothetical protein